MAEMAGAVAVIAVNRTISGKALDKPSKVRATPGPNLVIRRFCVFGTGNPFLPTELQPAPETRPSTGGKGLFNCRLDRGAVQTGPLRSLVLRTIGGRLHPVRFSLRRPLACRRVCTGSLEPVESG